MFQSAIIIIAVICIVYIWIRDRIYAELISEITPGVFISDQLNSVDEAALQRNGITRVITISRDKKTPGDLAMYQRNGISHWQFPLDDLPEAPIHLIFYEVHRVIGCHRTLVHCRMGISRSVTAVAAHLMLRDGISATAAIEKIKSRRRCAAPNSGFRAQLDRLESRNAKRTIGNAPL